MSRSHSRVPSLSSTPVMAASPSFADQRVDDEDNDSLEEMLKGREGEDGTQTPPTPPADVARSNVRNGPPVPAWFIIIAWIALSSTVIFYNRKIMVDDNFPYPVTLTTVHLLFQTIVTRLLHRYTNLIAGTINGTESGASSSYSLLPMSSSQASIEPTVTMSKEAAVSMSWPDWRRKILPIASLTSASLVLSNSAYLFISTSFIHMLKSFAPVAILIAAFALRTKQPNVRLVSVILVITAGTALATHGEVNFNLIGFSLQSIAIAVEATRVTLIQILLQGDNMSPLKSLYHFALICMAFNLILIIPLEGIEPFLVLASSSSQLSSTSSSTTVGPLTLLSNAALTFLLTISSTYLIGISAIVLSLSKVIKDVLIVLASAIWVGDTLSAEQIVGYGVATIGLVAYKTLKL